VRTGLTAQLVQENNSSSSSTCGDDGNNAGMLSSSLGSLPFYILAEEALGWKVGPLVDPFMWLMMWPIFADLSPARQQRQQQQQEQLYGLLFTALKLIAAAPQQGPAADVFSLSRICCIKPVCKAASSIIYAGLQKRLQRLQRLQQQQDSQSLQEDVCNRQPGKEAAAAAAADVVTTSSSSSVTGSSPAAAADTNATNVAADMLPCLAILGRGCLCCAEQMQRLQGEGHAKVGTYESCWRGIATSLRPLLNSRCGNSVVEQLELLGYQDVTRHLMQLLETVEDFLMRLTEQRSAAAGTYMDAETSDTMQQLHQRLGSVLACFAVPLACNNPHCRNVSGQSEA